MVQPSTATSASSLPASTYRGGNDDTTYGRSTRDNNRILSNAQRTAMGCVSDVLVPPLPVPPNEDSRNPELRRYWEHQLSSDPAYLEAVEAAIAKLPDAAAGQLKLVLTLLSTSWGTTILTGRLTATPFTKLDKSQQTELLLRMQSSDLSPPFRQQAFQGLKKLLTGLAYSYTVAGKNPYWPAMGYPGPPQLLSEGGGGSSNSNAKQLVLHHSDDTSRTVAAMAQQSWIQSALQPPMPTTNDPSSSSSNIECDVLIVGSGSGGCVAASILARAGYRVLVLDQGPYLSPADVTNLEADAFEQLYEQHGLLTTSNGAMTVLAASALGGGTAVNWGCCLPLPDYVRDEWLSNHNLDAFAVGGEYDKALDYVLIKLGVVDGKLQSPTIQHSKMNQKLQAGCGIMGYAWEVTGQSIKDTGDPCAGYLCFGDRYGNKNSGVSVFLKDAAKHGARILPNCRVERIQTVTDPGPDEDDDDNIQPIIVSASSFLTMTSSSSSSVASKRRRRASVRPRAVGAKCRVGDRTIHVSARKAVVVAGGALRTPCLLQESGLGNPHIGRHLRLHPVTNVVGLYGKDTTIDPYLGAPMTTVCNEFELGPKGDGYGARIECPSAHPGLMASSLGWKQPGAFKDQMREVRNAVPLIVLQRDNGEGSVRLARDGRSLVIDYTLHEHDKASMTHALNGGLQVLMTSGAKYVTTSNVRDPGLQLDEQGPQSLFKLASNERIQNYLSLVSSLEIKNHQVGLFSAHQMGTCRLSTSPLLGAVDVNGETWDCDNLYVMDSSLFPTASGVNPMVTVMALAKMLSSRLATRLRYQDQRPMGTFESVRAQELLTARHELRSQQYPSYSQHKRLHLPRVRLPSAKVLVPLLFVIAALLLAISVVGLLVVKLRQAPPPVPVVEESWAEALAKKVGDIQMPGLIPTSVMWTLLLFPFF